MAWAGNNVQGEQVRAKNREILELSKREGARQERIARATADLATAEEELANLPVYEPPTHELVSSYRYLVKFGQNDDSLLSSVLDLKSIYTGEFVVEDC